MPYRKPVSTDGERGSGSTNNSRVLSPSDTAIHPVAEIPDLVMRGAQRLTSTSRPSPQDNIMKFWQAERQDEQRDNLEHSSTVEPAAEIEVGLV